MRTLRLTCLAGLSIFLLSVSASTARAETFVLTGDEALSGGHLLHLFLSAPNFSLLAAAEDAPALARVRGCENRVCTSGDTFILDFSTHASEFTAGSEGFAVVNGTDYFFRITDGNVQWAGTTIVPTLTDPQTTFSLPFTMSGNFVATNLRGTATIFSVAFEASGIADVTLRNFSQPNQVFFPEFVNFNITSGKAQFDPVPEPVTILLLSTGLAGVALVRRRRS